MTEEVQLVWTGPSSATVPVRSMAAVLEDLIAEAQSELVIMTYSARRYEPVRAALAVALARGVRVDIVVETLTGAGSAMSGGEPAAAFAGLPGLSLWDWPKSRRGTESAKMHAKLAVADGRALLVSSANLTSSGCTTASRLGCWCAERRPRSALWSISATSRFTAVLCRLKPEAGLC
jgi:phosphatidylserine/phosphatidylglycerophosphate/cardiolipin synthase-like enzyme